MKTKIISLLLSVMLVITLVPAFSAEKVYAKESEPSIQASDITFTSGEQTSKLLDITIKDVDEKNIALLISDTSIFTAEFADDPETGALKIKINPNDIGHGTLKIYDVTNEDTVFTEVKVSIWEDLLPAPPTVTLLASSTDETITVTNQSKHVPEGAVFEYSLNNVVFQTDPVFKGLTPETEYSIYTRVRAKVGENYYTIYKSQEPEVTVTTKKKEEQPVIREYFVSNYTIKQGIVFTILLPSDIQYNTISYRSDNESIATISNGNITAKEPGDTKVYVILDEGTDKQITYYYNVTVSEKLKINFTAVTQNDKVVINCDKTSVKIKSGDQMIECKAKFSFDMYNWTDSPSISRSAAHPQDTIYGCYIDNEGFQRCEVIEIPLNAKSVEKNEKKTADNISIKLGQKHSLEINKEESDTYTYYFTTGSESVAKVTASGVVSAVGTGKTDIKLTEKTYSFTADGTRVITVTETYYPVTVTKDDSNGNNDGSDDSDSNDKDGKENKDNKNENKDNSKKNKKLILAVPTIELKDDYFIYNKKVQTPKFTIKINNKVIKSNLYTVTHSKGRKNVGRYCITVKMKPESGYTGTKRLYYYIMPKKMAGFNIKNASNGKVKASWKKGSPGITGYEIQYAKSGTFKNSKSVKVKGISTTSKTLKIKKGYYVRVRAYYYSKESKKTIYSQWSNIKKVK